MIDTDIIITAPMSPDAVRALFDHSRAALGAGEGATWRHGPSIHYLPGNAEFEMHRGQGLPAHLRVVYSTGRPIVRTPEPELPPIPESFIQVHLQSGGFDAVQVHARLAREIGAWLNVRKLPWQSQHEGNGWQTGLGSLHTPTAT